MAEIREPAITAADYYRAQRRYASDEPQGPGEVSLYTYYVACAREDGTKPTAARWEAFLESLPLSSVHLIIAYTNRAFELAGEDEADGEDPTSGS